MGVEDLSPSDYYPLSSPKKATMSVLGTRLNYIRGWCSSVEALGNVKNPFIGITPSSTLTQISSTCQGPICGLKELFNYILDE